MPKTTIINAVKDDSVSSISAWLMTNRYEFRLDWQPTFKATFSIDVSKRKKRRALAEWLVAGRFPCDARTVQADWRDAAGYPMSEDEASQDPVVLAALN